MVPPRLYFSTKFSLGMMSAQKALIAGLNRG